MSNLSSGSSSRKSRFDSGIPKRCWCGFAVSLLMSNSGQNPHQCYFCCLFAVKEKLVDDEHVFKWFDEAIVNEIERINRHIVQMESKRLEQINVEQLQVKIEQEIIWRVDVVIAESECKMKKVLGCAMVLGCMATVGRC